MLLSCDPLRDSNTDGECGWLHARARCYSMPAPALPARASQDGHGAAAPPLRTRATTHQAARGRSTQAARRLLLDNGPQPSPSSRAPTPLGGSAFSLRTPGPRLAQSAWASIQSANAAATMAPRQGARAAAEGTTGADMMRVPTWVVQPAALRAGSAQHGAWQRTSAACVCSGRLGAGCWAATPGLAFRVSTRAHAAGIGG